MQKHPVNNQGYMYDSVEEYLNAQSRNFPVRWSEILNVVNKSQGSIGRELKYLIKMGLIHKREVDVLGFKIIYYRKVREDDKK